MNYQYAPFDIDDQDSTSTDLREFLESTTDCICILDQDWRFTYLSRCAERELGVSRQPLLGRTLWAAFPEALGSSFELEYRRAMARRESVQFEAYFSPLLAWYAVQVVPLRSGGIGISFRNINDCVERKAALESAKERFYLATQATQDVVFDWEFASGKLKWHQTTNKSLGYGREDLGQNIDWWLSRIHPDDQTRVAKEVRDLLVGSAKRFESEYRLQRADSSYAEVLVRGFVTHAGEGRTSRLIGAIQDNTERNTSARALKDSETLYRSVLEASADCIEVINLDGTVHLVNRAVLDAMALDRVEQVQGTPWVDHWPEEARSDLQAAFVSALSGKSGRFSTFSSVFRETTRWWDVVVSPMCDEGGRIIRILAIARDTTAQRETASQLKWASEHDALTELPNRRAFKERLDAATIRAMASGGAVGLLLIDLDHFKHVNDSLGHTAGDHLLSIFSYRLSCSVRKNDFVARLGGDEFAVILESEADDLDLADVGADILSRLQKPIRFEDRHISASASLGGAVFPRDAGSANELFDNADIALYALKASGRGGTKMFEPEMRDQAQIISSQLNLARVSVNDATVVPHYQQKIDLKTGKIVGFEALLRWRHWARGIQEPSTVAEAFKDYELAAKISELMQEKVFGDLRGWIERALPVGMISINAAPVEFLRDDFAERMLVRMERHNIPPELIELEVTEHVFLERSSDYVGRALRVLYSKGVRIALDDFGTGYSSLSHLRDFPVNVVKIDRSFVDRIAHDPEIMAIVSAVINLAQSLNIKVVAEGIETMEQEALLQNEGCPFGQGYLFGKPVSGEELPRLLGALQVSD